jgi:hypothetical protein
MAGIDLGKLLESAGISASSYDRVRLSRGVVGKSSYVAGLALIVLIVAAYSSKDTTYLLAIAILAAIIFVVFFVGALWFASKNPGLALLEGAELIQWRQLEMTAKDVPKDIQISGASPTAIGQAGDDQ